MRRLFEGLVDTAIVLLGVSTLVFLLLSMVPGDPVDVILGESAQATDRNAMREALGLDQPLAVRWLRFHADLLRGDLGDSLVRRAPVAELIGERLPATLTLAVSAFALVLLVAVPLGLLAVRHHRRWPDRVAQAVALVGLSIPNFWLGPLLVLAFSIGLGWLPVSGNNEPGSLLLPAFTLGFSMTAITMRMLRSSLLEIGSQPFVRTARCKGLSERAVLLRHTLPNALGPVITVLGMQLGGLLAGAVITEVVFAWPGLGSLLVDAIRQRDYPLVQGIVLLIAVGYVLTNRLADSLAAWVDPRIADAR